MNTDEEALHAAKVLYGVAHADLPGGKTQAIAQMQVIFRQLLDASLMASYPRSPFGWMRAMSPELREALKPPPGLITDAAFDEFRKPENISARLDQYVRDDQERQRLWDDDFSTALQGISVSNDGIALSSVSHPRAPFWSRVWSWFFPPKLHAAALEQTVLDLGNGEGLTYERFKAPPAAGRYEGPK